MGFKNIKKEKSENDFINSARGDEISKNIKEKRNKTFLVYFTEIELNKIKSDSDDMGMGINQYIRFKIFNNWVIKWIFWIYRWNRNIISRKGPALFWTRIT